MTYRLGSLFSGYGGLDMAVQSALGPAHLAWLSDIKPASVALLAHQHPGVPNLGDLTAVDFTAVDPIDVLAASWPCQPHSAAGKRLGEKDPRALWPHVARAIAETRPAIFLGENVARIASNGELRRVVRSLAELGYVGAWRCIRASDVGACHRRDRCFVVAVAPDALGEAGRFTGHAEQGDGASSTGVRAPESGRRDLRAGVTLLPTPTRRNVHGPDHRGRRADGGGCGYDLQTAVTLLPTPCVVDWKGANPLERVRDGRPRTPGDDDLPTAIKRLETQRWGKYAEAIARHEQVLGRPAPEPTQASERNGNPQLSARFVEWMMMLPEGWVTDVPGLVDSPRRSVRNAQLSLLGDGVVPAQGAAAFRFLLDHLAARPELAGAA